VLRAIGSVGPGGCLQSRDSHSSFQGRRWVASLHPLPQLRCSQLLGLFLSDDLFLRLCSPPFLGRCYLVCLLCRMLNVHRRRSFPALVPPPPSRHLACPVQPLCDCSEGLHARQMKNAGSCCVGPCHSQRESCPLWRDWIFSEARKRL
jgi:hypothetical protein